MEALAGIVQTTLAGMGFELVDLQRSGRGRLLRLFIDRPGGVTVGDCAEVSRQLARVFAVEGVDYERLEVSSPGLDRSLRRAEDEYQRFVFRDATYTEPKHRKKSHARNADILQMQ